MSGTFGLTPTKHDPKTKGLTQVQLRRNPEDTWGPVKALKVTQDAEGNLAVCDPEDLYYKGKKLPVESMVIFYPRKLWRLA